MKPIPLYEFEIEVDVILDIEEQKIARTELNLHFFNDTVCNHWVGGNLVAKYPEIEKANPQIFDAFSNVVRSNRAIVIMQLMSDGTLRQTS
jgi:hypothetical protein